MPELRPLHLAKRLVPALTALALALAVATAGPLRRPVPMHWKE